MPPPIILPARHVADAASYPLLPARDARASPELALDGLATRTLSDAAPAAVAARQNPAQTTLVVVPAQYGNMGNSPDPGAVVGIVLGSVAGFLLLLWLFYSCVDFGDGGLDGLSSVGTASVLTLRTRRSSGHRHHHHHHHKPAPVRLRATETVEVRARERDHRSSGGGPIIVEAAPSVERIVLEERRSSRAPRVVHSDDDEVVVMEEDSPPRRRRSSVRRSGEVRRESVYREVSRQRSRRRS